MQSVNYMITWYVEKEGIFKKSKPQTDIGFIKMERTNSNEILILNRIIKKITNNKHSIYEATVIHHYLHISYD